MNKIISNQPAYAEIWAHNVTNVITSVNQNDWNKIVAFNTNGLNYRATPSYTNSNIIILVPGAYQIHAEWSGYGPAVAHDWNFHISKNNRSTTFNNATAHQTTPTTQKTESIGCSGLVQLAKGDTVELWVQRTSAGTSINLTTIHCTLFVRLMKKLL